MITKQNEKILRLPDVKQRTGLGRTSIYMKESQGGFPKRISLSARSVGWLESEVDEWIQDRISESRKLKTGGSNGKA